jgi:spermidine dehydrogenase
MTITRRDFLNGASLVVGGAMLPPAARVVAAGDAGAQYPPVLRGMRGSHDGAYEVAHALRDGRTFGKPQARDARYDLVVVGGGISGLSAAHFYQDRFGADARILVIDNHDDFGGHARRNEFWHHGRMYLYNGGTLNVEAPSQYSAVAAGLLERLGIDRSRYYASIREVKDRYRALGMRDGLFFDARTFGSDRLVSGYRDRSAVDFFAEAPLSDKARRDAVRLFDERRNYLPGRSPTALREKLMRTSYRNYLIGVVGCEPEVATLFDPDVAGLFAAGADVIPALYAQEMGFPGFAGMTLPEVPPELLAGEPGGQHGRENERRANSGNPDLYFPDGNATIARLLVASLVPGAIAARSMEDVVTARADYGSLDRDGNPVRIRLNSTVVNVAQRGHDEVAVAYVQGGQTYEVQARAVVLACWHAVIPHICPELPERQKTALHDAVKAPVVYSSVLVSNWRAFSDAGVSFVNAPGSFHISAGLATPLRLGAYESSRGPDEPVVVGMHRFPCKRGLSRREQHKAGRTELLETPFATFEREIRAQLDAMLGPHGFDAGRDILGITVNRWPHGYTYSYNPLFDPPEWAYTTTGERPNVIARQSHGRIAIANADAAASPHTDAAINEAWRAVTELAGG